MALLVVLTISSVALVACQSDGDTSAGDSPAPAAVSPSGDTDASPTLAPASSPVPTSTSITAPDPTSTPSRPQNQAQTPALPPPPDLNRDIHSVDLKDIVFDRFDGSTTRLSAASNALIERLRDAIKPVYSAQYDDASAGDWLNPDDTVLGYVSNDGQAYAYPIKYLNFHEIVNDVIDGVPLLISYCPLCASAVVFDRRVDGEVLVFGNTSALYNSDMVMFDHTSGSFWFQTGGEAIVGDMTGTRLAPLPSSIMAWSDWKELHPATKLLSREQGFGMQESQYLRDPFSTYAEYLDSGDNRYPFPVNTDLISNSLRPAEVVIAVAVGGSERAYPPALIGDAAVNDVIGGEPIVVFSRASGPVATVFSRQHGHGQLEFEFVDGEFRDVGTGSVWNLAGVAVSGEFEGARLRPLPSRRAFWFTISISSPEIEVYGQ